jgi:ribosomal protein L25 (general stress protein Ctc)
MPAAAGLPSFFATKHSVDQQKSLCFLKDYLQNAMSNDVTHALSG